ncbi:hypothetical protein [Phytobacter diazotrophicus]|uniref:hypothetical protein n=1 Tax=Phytobacter diazotrophicus TaxID=395631 RepID=UPI002FF6FBDD
MVVGVGGDGGVDGGLLHSLQSLLMVALLVVTTLIQTGQAQLPYSVEVLAVMPAAEISLMPMVLAVTIPCLPFSGTVFLVLTADPFSLAAIHLLAGEQGRATQAI